MTSELFQTTCGLKTPGAGGVVRAAGQQDVPGPDARALGLNLVQVVSRWDEDQGIYALLVTLRIDLYRKVIYLQHGHLDLL